MTTAGSQKIFTNETTAAEIHSKSRVSMDDDRYVENLAVGCETVTEYIPKI